MTTSFRSRLATTTAAILLGLSPISAGATAAADGTAGEAAGATEIAERSETFDFEIPAQGLNGAILAFAETSGIQVFYDTARLSGLHSDGLSGAYASAEALRRLLT